MATAAAGSTLTNQYALAQTRANDSVSGGDSLTQKYMSFLGPDAGRQTVGAYDRMAYQNYDMPEFYTDKNLFLRDTVTGFIVNEDIDWPTTVALPWFATDQIHITMNEWHFNTVLAGRVPHEGVSRLVTSSKKQFRDHTVRRGLAFVMEADFLDTPDGEVHYQRNLRGIVQCIQVTQNHDTIHALLTADKADRAAQADRVLDVSLTSLMEKQRIEYAALCYADDQITMMVAQNKRVLQKRGASADLLILPPTAGIYLTTVNPEAAVYWNFDVDGQLVQRTGPRTLSTLPDGIRVFETRDYDVDADEPPIDLLRRPQCVGEYYKVLVADLASAPDFSQYRSAWRAVHIYDETVDAFARIDFIQAVRASGVYNLETREGELSADALALATSTGTAKAATSSSSSSAMAAGASFMQSGEAYGAGDGLSETAADGALHRHMKRARHAVNAPRRSVFMMLSRAADGSTAPVRRFGEFDRDVVSDDDFVRAATSFAGKMSLVRDETAASHLRALKLVRELEAAQYSEAFFAALIAANGEGARTELGRDGVTQWQSNAYGSLALPEVNDEAGLSTGAVLYPPGFANMAGLRTLAAEAGRERGWRDAGREAREVVAYIDAVVASAKNIVPTSAALDAELALPWFTKRDPAAVFFETAIGQSHEPLFLRTSAAEAQGAVGAPAAAAQQQQQQPAAAAPAVAPAQVSAAAPLFTYGVREDASRLQAALAAANIRLVPAAGGAAEMYAFLDPAGQAHVAPAALVTDARVAPAFLVAEHLMGAGSHDAYRIVLERLAAQAAVAGGPAAGPRVRALVGAVLSETAAGRVQQARRAVTALAAIENEAEFNRSLAQLAPLAYYANTAAAPAAPKKAELAAASKAVATLAAPFGAEVDADRADALIPSAGDAAAAAAQAVVSPSAATAPHGAVRALATEVLALGRELTQRVAAAGGADAGAAVPAYTFAQKVAGAKATQEGAALSAQLKAKTAELHAAAAALSAPARGAPSLARQIAALTGSSGAAAAAAPKKLASSKQAAMRAGAYYGAEDESAFVRAPLSMTAALYETLPSYGESLVLPSVDGDWTRPDVAFVRERSVAVDARVHAGLFATTASHTAAEKSLAHTPFGLRVAGAAGAASGTKPSASSFQQFAGRRAPAAAAMDMYDDDDIVASAFSYGGGGASSASMIGERNFGPNTGYGDYGRAGGGGSYRVPQFGGVSANFARRFADLSGRIADPAVRAAAIVLLLLPNNLLAIERLVEHDVLVPFNVLLFRPLIEHQMSTAILMQSGLTTGGNMYGDSNFAFGADAVSKRVYGNFTFYSKAMVWKPRHIVRLENIKPEGYVGGNDTRFIMERDDFRKQGLQRPSIVAALLPSTENHFPNAISMTGSFVGLVPDVNPVIDDDAANFKNHFSAAGFLERRFALQKQVSDEHDLTRDYFESQHAMNVVCFPGAQFTYNVTRGDYSKVTTCAGHWKEHGCGRGAAAVRNGKMKFFPKQDWSTYHLT